MSHILATKRPLKLPLVRFALVLVAAVALLLTATPVAFAASAHSANHTPMKASAVPGGCGNVEFPCDGLLLDGQVLGIDLSPSSADCNPINEFGNLFECDVTLSGYFLDSPPPPINWVATTTNLGTGIHVSPSSGTLVPGQSVTVRIYPLSSSRHGGYISFTAPGQWYAGGATVYWN